MKIHVSLVVLALLQLGLPSGVAQESQGNLRRGDNKAEETERELRPYGYPVARRPGQNRLYGAPGSAPGSLLGFRSYTNSNAVAQQGTLPLAQGATQQQQFVPKKSGKAAKGGFVAPPQRGFRRPARPAAIPKRADGSFDGTFVASVPQTGSLGQALGFYKVETGSTIIFVQDENDDAAVVEANAAAAMQTDPPEPTVSPAPTLPVTPSPTAEPTINPTKAPTPVPTLKPTNEPTLPPTKAPTFAPTKRPTRNPTVRPSRNPTQRPTRSPTKSPTL
mmetsp:Transcript_3020/g.7122  ORF Transcript_3020/g.7122 Transcript_3020/m.7122 type:complete len:276 (-) Transcript_3020:145-972(-)|eukprot:CAMPEP_0116100976 /NCGR_PEP_ID=MMETSP0327-20121206/12565_1 /TAXON_ID=44447 /ORGANISM="Pseudo-nitzschia delicatissima, Strain B596" /LENGTH=275 /DNA_ID=CAMNT_0003592909 /DNA_START=258 /DNA_END=1085 /DNA_ORIENTATION=-